MRVYDFMFRQPPDVLACLKASGATGVARYLDPYNPKGITKDEVQDIHAAGLDLHLFFETTGGATRPDLYFTRAQGVADCLAAQDELAKLGAPKGMLVWFAVDTNVEPSLVTGYCNGIESVATDALDPQLYGFQRLCEYAQANFPQMGKRPAQTYGTPTVNLALWQHEQQTICGVLVDLDEVYVPGWKPQGGTVSAPIYQGQSVADVNITVGEVAMIEGIWQYAGLNRHITQKVYGTTPGIFSVTLRPPVDPDADPTVDLSAQPAYFIVAVRPQ